jgi:urease beta subunit
LRKKSSHVLCPEHMLRKMEVEAVTSRLSQVLSHFHTLMMNQLRAIRTFLRSEADTVGNSFKSSSNRRGSKPLIAGYKTKYM